MQSFTAQGANGSFTLPMMSQVYRLTTVPETNDKGEWFGWEISRERQLDLNDAGDKSLFTNAMSFCGAVKEGDVEIKPEAQHNKQSKAPNVPKEPPVVNTDDDLPF